MTPKPNAPVIYIAKSGQRSQAIMLQGVPGKSDEFVLLDGKRGVRVRRDDKGELREVEK